jgi:hypothetical protein
MSTDRKIEKVAANLDDLSRVTEELSQQPAPLPNDMIEELHEGLEETSDLVDEIVDEESDSGGSDRTSN